MFPIGCWGPTEGGAQLPTQSILFVGASSQNLQLSNTDWGAYNRSLWSYSLWLKRSSSSASADPIMLFKGGATAATREFIIQFDNDRLNFSTYKDSSGTINGRLLTSSTYTDTTNFHHYYFTFDVGAAAGDRLRIWYDGAEVTTFTTDTNPDGAIQTTTNSIFTGARTSNLDPADGLFYQASFFSGTIPTINDLYDSGSPLSVVGLPGLWSYLDVAGGSVTSDPARGVAWTNNNTATASSTIP